MDIFDNTIITFLNQFSQRSWLFDELILMVANNKLFKGGVLVTIMWYMWFRKDLSPNQKNVREHVLITLIISIVAIAVGKTLALMLPFRYRPIHDPLMNFKMPYGILESAETNDGVMLSSMPSDHAVLYFALAVGLYFMSKKIGVMALIYTVLFIAAPRIYLGLHFPSDILIGAIVGIVISLIGNMTLKNSKFIKIIMEYSRVYPGVFYALFFLICYQIADLFTDSYGLVKHIISFYG